MYTKADLPPAFWESVTGSNDFTPSGAMRNYHASILSGDGFKVASPLTGKDLQPTAAFVAPNSAILYRFEEGDTSFIILASVLHFGFPLCSLHFKGQDGISLGDFGTPHLPPPVRTALAEWASPTVEIDWHETPTIYIGNANFAHFMWNECPALYQILESGTSAKIALQHDPLGVSGPLLAQSTLAFDECTTGAGSIGWKSSLPVNIAGRYLDENSKANLLESFLVPSQSLAPDHEGPNFYFTIRNRGRTVSNQSEFLSCLTQSVLTAYPESHVILDGFSYPADFHRKIYDGYREMFSRRDLEAREIATGIKATIAPSLQHRVIDITGSSLPAAIATASACDYYVAHSGTSQHKIGWFFAIPGTMHGNQASIVPAALRWTGTQTAGSLAPNSIPKDLIEDLSRIDLPNEVDRNRDYSIIDVNLAVEFILRDIRERMKVPPDQAT